MMTINTCLWVSSYSSRLSPPQSSTEFLSVCNPGPVHLPLLLPPVSSENTEAQELSRLSKPTQQSCLLNGTSGRDLSKVTERENYHSEPKNPAFCSPLGGCTQNLIA